MLLTQPILGQQNPAISNIVTFIDVRGSSPVNFTDIGAIGLFVQGLSSLSRWYTVQHWSSPHLPARWELAQMSSLRHLSIAVHTKNRYSTRSWHLYYFWGNPKAIDLRVLPRLETLKIPLLLFKDPDADSMCKSQLVLPATLKTLVLFVDLRPNTARRYYTEESEWEHKGYVFSISRSCGQSIRLTIDFLNDIKRCAHGTFPRLCKVTVEYKMDKYTGGDRSFRDAAMEYFIAQLRRLEAEFGMQGINFSLIAL